MNPLAHPDYYIIRTLYYIRTLNFCILLNAQCTYAVQCRSRMSNAINGKPENNYGRCNYLFFEYENCCSLITTEIIQAQ